MIIVNDYNSSSIFISLQLKCISFIQFFLFTDNIYLRIIVNWLLASCYLYSPGMVGFAVQKIGNLSGLPSSYFKFTNIILLASILNVIHTYTFVLRVTHGNHWKSLVYYCPIVWNLLHVYSMCYKSIWLLYRIGSNWEQRAANREGWRTGCEIGWSWVDQKKKKCKYTGYVWGKVDNIILKSCRLSNRQYCSTVQTVQQNRLLFWLSWKTYKYF